VNSASERLPSVSIVVATHGRAALLIRLLESLAGDATSIDPRENIHELLVVENGPPSGAEEACAEASSRLPVRYAHLPEIGKSPALNHAVAQAEGDFLLFLDDDVRLCRDIVGLYRRAASRYGPGHFFGGPVAVDRETEPPEWLREYLPTSVLGWSLGDRESYQHSPEFHGANWGAFREDLLASGGFAAHLGPTRRYRALAEETELQERMLAQDLRAVYLPEARVWHQVPRQMCTLRWARRRAYQASLSKALQGQFDSEPPLIAGAPRWLYRKCAEDTLRWLAALVTMRKPAERVALDIQLARSWGRLVGHIETFRMPAKSRPSRGAP
jgi:GT2 family glycosyltransferase